MSLIYGVLRQVNKMRTILVNKRRQGIFWTLFLEFKNREGALQVLLSWASSSRQESETPGIDQPGPGSQQIWGHSSPKYSGPTTEYSVEIAKQVKNRGRREIGGAHRHARCSHHSFQPFGILSAPHFFSSVSLLVRGIFANIKHIEAIR